MECMDAMLIPARFSVPGGWLCKGILKSEFFLKSILQFLRQETYPRSPALAVQLYISGTLLAQAFHDETSGHAGNSAQGGQLKSSGVILIRKLGRFAYLSPSSAWGL